MTDQEHRRYARFEPPLLDAIVCVGDHCELRGRVLDSSEGGIAIALPDTAELPSRGAAATIKLINGENSHPSDIASVNASVNRHWSEKGMLDEGRGVAFQYAGELPDSLVRKMLLRGIRQKTRLHSQRELAAADMKYLGDYRRDLVACQTKLYLHSLTVGVALAGVYFGLVYHSFATDTMNDVNLSFWRTAIAALPGWLAMACALMVAQKSISIQRIDAFLAVLKECSIMQQFPREYRGWETADRRFRRVLDSTRCASCKAEKRCSHIGAEEKELADSRTMFRRPKIALYHFLVFTSFFVVIAFSVAAVVGELVQHQLGGPLIYMAISAASTVLLGALLLGLVRVFRELRKGKYSSDYFRFRWLNLLNRCRYQ